MKLQPGANLSHNQQALTALVQRVWLDILSSVTKFPRCVGGGSEGSEGSEGVREKGWYTRVNWVGGGKSVCPFNSNCTQILPITFLFLLIHQ